MMFTVTSMIEPLFGSPTHNIKRSEKNETYILNSKSYRHHISKYYTFLLGNLRESMNRILEPEKEFS